MVRSGVLCLSLLFFAACSSEKSAVTWRLVFSDSTLEDRATSYTAQIRSGPCWSEDGLLLYDEHFQGDQGPPVPTLQSGAYAFSAAAIDGHCIRFAEGCEQVTLPVQGDSQVLVFLDESDESPTCDGTCIEGVCDESDSGVDADVEDADIEDADVEDVEDADVVEADIDPEDGDIEDADVPPGDLLCGPMVATAVASTTDSGFFSLRAYEGELYAGTYGTGKIYSSSNDWAEPIVDLNVGESVYIMLPYDGHLYANTENRGEVWRSADGLVWEKVFDGTATAVGTGLEVFGGHIYAAYTTLSNNAARVYRSATGDRGTWNHVFGHSSQGTDMILRELVEYDGSLLLLYYALDIQEGGLYTSPNGTTWNYANYLPNIRIIKAHRWGGFLWVSSSPMSGNTRVPPAGVYRWNGTRFDNVYEDAGRRVGTDILDFRGGLYFVDDANWRATTGNAGLHCSNTGDRGTWSEVHAFLEAEATDMEVLGWDLYVATRQQGGSGRVYRVEPE